MNRLKEGVCVVCGGPLIELEPEMGMCRTCRLGCIAQVQAKVKHRKDPSGTGPRRKLKIGSLKRV